MFKLSCMESIFFFFLLFDIKICNNSNKNGKISENTSNYERKKINFEKDDKNGRNKIKLIYGKNDKCRQKNKFHKFAIFLCFFALIFIRISWDLKLKFGDFSTKNNSTDLKAIKSSNVKKENDRYKNSDNSIIFKIKDNNNTRGNDNDINKNYDNIYKAVISYCCQDNRVHINLTLI